MMIHVDTFQSVNVREKAVLCRGLPNLGANSLANRAIRSGWFKGLFKGKGGRYGNLWKSWSLSIYFHIFPVFSWINPFTKHLEQDAGVMSVPDPAWSSTTMNAHCQVDSFAWFTSWFVASCLQDSASTHFPYTCTHLYSIWAKAQDRWRSLWHSQLQSASLAKG